MRRVLSVSQDGSVLRVRSDYDPLYVEEARSLGGRWDGEAWCFDVRDRSRVERLLAEVYGWLPEGANGETYRARLKSDGLTGGTVRIGRRVVVYTTHRDAPVRYGWGVVQVGGGRCVGGGSIKYPAVWVPGGAVFEVRDCLYPLEDDRPGVWEIVPLAQGSVVEDAVAEEVAR